MSGAIPPLPNTPSLRGAWLSTGTTLPFSFISNEIHSSCAVTSSDKLKEFSHERGSAPRIGSSAHQTRVLETK
jgi:hypothetical protein